MGPPRPPIFPITIASAVTSGLPAGTRKLKGLLVAVPRCQFPCWWEVLLLQGAEGALLLAADKRQIRK
jgi:hypothetical protein